MELSYVIGVLSKLDNPLYTRLGSYIAGIGIPRFKFRGGEMGKYFSSITEDWYVGTEEKDLHRGGSTVVEYTLGWALFFTMLRTDTEPEAGKYKSQIAIECGRDPRGKGGRHDSNIGRQLKQYRYGFPFLIAIDTKSYTPKRINAVNNPNEVIIYGPINLDDIVVLFDRETDHLGEIPKIRNSEIYQDLVERRRLAEEEKPRQI